MTAPPSDAAPLAPTHSAALDVVDDPVEQQQFTRWQEDPVLGRVAVSALQLGGLYCAACAVTIEQALLALDGVLGAEVSAASQRASVRWDPARTRPSMLIQVIRDAGYQAVPDALAPVRELRRLEHRKALWRLFVASFCAMQVMMFATPSYVAGAGELSMDMRKLLNWGSWVVSLPVVCFAAGPFFAGAWRALRQRRIGMDVPVALGVLVTFVASTAATFDPAGVFGQEVYFDSLTMFVAFLLAGRYLELRARHQAASSLESALAALPATAWRMDELGQWQEVSALRLRPLDKVRVPVGQAFPADGVVLQGDSLADESLLSGESRPVPKSPGSQVIGGSLNHSAPVVMQVQRVGADTRLEAIIALVRDAMTQRPSATRVADRWAGPFLWGVLLLAAGAAAAWSLIDPTRAVWVAVSVLIVTCPCALGLATPAALLAATGALARRGVLVQRIEALETLAVARRLFVDKTGTLTEEQPRLSEVVLVEPQIGEDGARSRAAALAQWSTHPLSMALRAERLPADASAWTEVSETPGQGLQARDASGRIWRLGSAQWVGAAADARSQVWLSCEGRPVARFTFDESLRDGAAQALGQLRAQGWHITLLSGDAPERAERWAHELGLDAVIGGAAPQDKLDALAAAQALGAPVVMAGDGVNDAPVLARADVSLAMGHGALVARAHADAVILSSAPQDIVHLQQLAGRTMHIVRQNLHWALSYNAVSVPLALMGWLPPWAAGLGMAASSLVVIGNALRLAR